MYNTSLKELAKSDAVMRQIIRRVGPCLLQPDRKHSPFQTLIRAIAHQQLHGKAAATILARFERLFGLNGKPAKKFPTPEQVLAQPIEQLRSVGFSGSKVVAIRDLAEKTLEGIVPTARQIIRLSDEAIIERLTQVRGIGRWSVEMLLIFHLGRLDVWPVDDFGVKNGFRVAYDLAEMPTKKELAAAGDKWRPYRSLAAWYLWRIADLDKAEKVPKKPVKKPTNKPPLKVRKASQKSK